MDIVPSPGTPSDAEDSEEDSAPAVWHDSDDERLAVSLAGQAKLRKLRVAESEDVISGKEYVRRLRRQFQRLHPTPEWANPELAAKRRKINSDDEDNDQEMESDDEDEQLSMQPLARLLQNANDLTRIEDNARTGGKRKLRQEVLDIQRLKDVGKSQPVRQTMSANPYGREESTNSAIISLLSTHSLSTLTTRSSSPLDPHRLSSCTTFLPQHQPRIPS